MPRNYQVQLVSVFAAGPGGGNPAPIVIDATGMSDAEMQQVARTYGHESGFVLPAPPDSDCDFEFRFWVPNHEMSMCGHAAVGAVWLLDHAGKLPAGKLPQQRLAVWTKSGRVEVQIGRSDAGGAAVEISQPAGLVEPLPDADNAKAEILDVLRITSDRLAPFPIHNASTSRVKTLIPLASAAELDRLQPDFARVEALCERIGSTGLYPYALSDGARQMFDARQFPKASGYPEDAATGIAAAALSFGLLANGMVEGSERPITIRQGRAMRRPSEISVRFQLDNGRPSGCWLGGAVELEPSGAA